MKDFTAPSEADAGPIASSVMKARLLRIATFIPYFLYQSIDLNSKTTPSRRSLSESRGGAFPPRAEDFVRRVLEMSLIFARAGCAGACTGDDGGGSDGAIPPGGTQIKCRYLACMIAACCRRDSCRLRRIATSSVVVPADRA
jgi:hypothetical protein